MINARPAFQNIPTQPQTWHPWGFGEGKAGRKGGKGWKASRCSPSACSPGAWRNVLYCSPGAGAMAVASTVASDTVPKRPVPYLKLVPVCRQDILQIDWPLGLTHAHRKRVSSVEIGGKLGWRSPARAGAADLCNLAARARGVEGVGLTPGRPSAGARRGPQDKIAPTGQGWGSRARPQPPRVPGARRGGQSFVDPQERASVS